MTKNQPLSESATVDTALDAAYIHNVNAAVALDRDDLILDLVAEYDEERRAASAPNSSQEGKRRLSRWRHRAARLRTSVDAYTIDTFNPSPFLTGPRNR